MGTGPFTEPWPHPWKQQTSPISHNSHQLPVVSQLEVGLQEPRTHPHLGFSWLTLVWILSTQPLPLWVNACNRYPVMFSNYGFSAHISSFWLSQTVQPLFVSAVWALREGSVLQMSRLSEHFTLLVSACWLEQVSVLTATYCKMQLLWR